MWKPHAPPPPRVTKSPDPDSESKQRNVRRIAQIVKLKPEFVDKYKEVHDAVWPEVLQQIKDCNIRDYSIYHDPTTAILFATFKYVGYDYAGDMERMRKNPKVREWWAMTDGFQESIVPGAQNSESGNPAWWKVLDEVFYLE
ncbi:rhamnose mutarotase [Hypoxylon trugodes]|uniref:rhamnose mutarotase n=1 Tax=Hypoxylon trugodes TaxID=326681 RepID=UPI00218F86C0|nr:rhamnose mutarotase [Hypoxylon trugodes]KAI1392234.1 rhamnose mutarotase [Hypoxylon trugodes]